MEAIKYKLNPLYIETKSQRVQILARPSTIKKIKKIAKEKKVSTNDMINRILEDYISKNPEKFNLENELKKLEVKEFEKNGKNWALCYNVYHNNFDFYNEANLPRACSIYFTKESLDKFYNNVKDKKITKEQFFRAYKNVFGGRNAN